MSIIARINSINPSLANYALGLSESYTSLCLKHGIEPSESVTAISCGGGKDSTTALILMSAVSEITKCKLISSTMVHLGQNEEIYSNIERITKELNVQHEYRYFSSKLASNVLSNKNRENWKSLLTNMAYATNFSPRFMCVACNLASTTSEVSTITDNAANFIVTGNSPAELDKFRQWIINLNKKFPSIVPVVSTNHHSVVKQYNSWYSIYKALINEIFHEHENFNKYEQYLFNVNALSDSKLLDTFSVIGANREKYNPVDFFEMISTFGWQMPQSIQGGTESDCAFTSAIAYINITKNGLDRHIEDLKTAAESCTPLPFMMDRAIRWANTGLSQTDGFRQINELGIAMTGNATTSKLALSLVSELLPVR